MTILLDDRTLGMWCIEIPPRVDAPLGGNWTGHLSKLNDGYQFRMRYRWYRDDRLYPDSKDVRREYQPDELLAGIDNDRAAILRARDVCQTVKRVLNGSWSWEVLRGELTTEEFMALLAKQRGMHFSLR